MLPPFRDWVSSAGFGGAAALLAAFVVVLTVMATSRRSDRRLERELELRERHHQEARQAEQRAAAIDRCWERLVWVVRTADMEPAASDPEGANMGLGPELAEELLRGLVRDAKELEDQTLAMAAAVYLSQLGLVLAQQTGRVAEVAVARSALADGNPGPPSDGGKAATAAAPAVEGTAATVEVGAGQGRRRR